MVVQEYRSKILRYREFESNTSDEIQSKGSAKQGCIFIDTFLDGPEAIDNVSIFGVNNDNDIVVLFIFLFLCLLQW